VPGTEPTRIRDSSWPRRAVFLDRDGTVIRDVEYLRDPDQIELLDGCELALNLLRKASFELVIVSNQSGVARGIFDEATARRCNDALLGALGQRGVDILASYFCPFHPSANVERYRRESECRKPRPGMLLRAAEEHGIDLSGSFMIGDKKSDVLAGRAAGCASILVLTGKGGQGEPDLSVMPNFVAKDLVQAADWICRSASAHR
jgi:D-glycero-D-manno-heptose 1,7-bisphosphate phosphatase